MYSVPWVTGQLIWFTLAMHVPLISLTRDFGTRQINSSSRIWFVRFKKDLKASAQSRSDENLDLDSLCTGESHVT